MKKKICAVTGSRAEFGLIKHVLKKIEQTDGLEFSLVVTGAHLSKEFGYTVDEIVQEGFSIAERVEMLMSSDTSVSIGKSIGLGVISLTECLKKLDPDILLIVGDRYEIFAAATAAMVNNIPIAHISGGEITEGAIDEQIRHALTKMSHIHFTTADENTNRILQMGEEAWRVHTVGGLWNENIRNLSKLSKLDLKAMLGLEFLWPTILVTYHPTTLQLGQVGTDIEDLLDVLGQLDAEIIFTYPNADAGGRVIVSKIKEFVAKHPKAKAFESLGSTYYLNVLSYVDLVVGNSSSGMVETQRFKLPVVNIGERQKGRLITENIILAEGTKNNISSAIQKALSKEFKQRISTMRDPYYKEDVATNIVRVLSELPSKPTLLRKQFVSIKRRCS